VAVNLILSEKGLLFRTVQAGFAVWSGLSVLCCAVTCCEWGWLLLQCSVVAMQRLLMCQSGWPVAERGGMLLLHLQRHPDRVSGPHRVELCKDKVLQYAVIVFVFKNI